MTAWFAWYLCSFPRSRRGWYLTELEDFDGTNRPTPPHSATANQPPQKKKMHTTCQISFVRYNEIVGFRRPSPTSRSSSIPTHPLKTPKRRRISVPWLPAAGIDTGDVLLTRTFASTLSSINFGFSAPFYSRTGSQQCGQSRPGGKPTPKPKRTSSERKTPRHHHRNEMTLGGTTRVRCGLSRTSSRNGTSGLPSRAIRCGAGRAPTGGALDVGDVQEGRGKTVPYHTRELSLGRLVRRRSGSVHYGLLVADG